MRGHQSAAAPSAESVFISEVFHTLSQPLTALHCTLELSLQRDDTVDELRASLQTALDNAERLRERLLLVRALNDADPSPESLQTIDLGMLLRELWEDLSLEFESGGRKCELRLCDSPLPVFVDRSRLTRALLVFAEYLYRYLPEGALLSLIVEERCGQAEIRISAASSLPMCPDDLGGEAKVACETELIRRTIAAANGEFALLDYAPGRGVWLARLPLARS